MLFVGSNPTPSATEQQKRPLTSANAGQGARRLLVNRSHSVPRGAAASHWSCRLRVGVSRLFPGRARLLGAQRSLDPLARPHPVR
jgi:hypothetical protein